MIATTPLMNETNSAADNSYATLFLGYVNQSLAEALTTVRAVETKLADEERVQACHVLDYGLHATYSWTYTRDLTIALSTYMERGGHWEIWQQLLQRAIVAAQEQNDSNHEITLTALLARLYQRWSKPKLMVQGYRRVIRLARRNNNRYEMARACSNLGYYYVESGQWWRAELLSLYALSIFNELKSNHGLAHTHNHLGVLFTRQCRWTEAEEHLNSACALWQANQDQFGLMRGHGNLGFLHHEASNYIDTIHHSTIALELARTSGEELLVGAFAKNISLGYLKTGNVQKAKEFADLAENVFKENSHKLGLAQLAHTNGLIAFNEMNYVQAQSLINYALHTLTDLHDYYFLIQVKLTKVHVEIQLHNYAVAAHELDELNGLITQYLTGNALQIYTDKLTESRCRLEEATRRHLSS
ncbi:MAG: hypothetical protein ACOYNY_45925 [Caldilineaceae bacterium]